MEHITEEDVRRAHLRSIREKGIEPFPAHTGKRELSAAVLQHAEGAEVTIAGRMVGKRLMGKLCFCHIVDETGRIQAAFSLAELGAEEFDFFSKNIDIADFVSVSGPLFVTHKGEKSVLVKTYTLLTKALLPLPEKWHGLTDVEQRYRKRYLDLIANEKSMQIARLRSLVVRHIRNYFDERGFFEVETPILQSLYGGANAKPFVTHHNALDIPLYLRIAPELYLKRLVVGGFEKVYEIARCFRNEGIDFNHNPEFTQIEFYWAYADYHDLMDLMEDLLPSILQAAGLPLILHIDGQDVDFTPPYPRRTMRDLIREYAHIDIEDYPDQNSLFEAAKKLKIQDVDEYTGRGKLVDEIYKTFARPKIVNPMFMIDHPVELSPLAKRKASDPRYVERMQLLCVGGNELCNAFSELNDPIDQEDRFNEQEKLRADGDEEGMQRDEDFLNALKHGMPPTAGLGMGIDRLIKLLSDSPNLKEVILFPTLRPERTDTDEKPTGDAPRV